MSDGADKRSVHTDALATLGTIIDENTGGRDAIHLAVIPVQAQESLMPGWHVTAHGTQRRLAKDAVGIVDPFLTKAVAPGEWFWLVIYPRKITSLRHVWAHPAFPEEAALDPEQAEAVADKLSGRDKEKAEAWIRDFAGNHSDSPSFEAIMEAVRAYDGEGYLTVGEQASGPIPPEFWDHVAVLTGRRFEQRAEHFSCAC